MVSRKLSQQFPALARQAHGWDPHVWHHVKSRRLWKCDLNHIWESEIASRIAGRGCPFCSSRRVLAGFNDLQTTNFELSLQAYNWDPTTVLAGSNQKQKWKCNSGHIWEARVSHRNRGDGCPYCKGLVAIPGENDLATLQPLIAREADGWDPTQFKPYSQKLKNWLCSEGHRWEATIKSRTTGKKCPTCFPKRKMENA
jgi:Probable Zinc-ribbon domain